MRQPVPGVGGFSSSGSSVSSGGSGDDWLARQRLANHLHDQYGDELERPRLLAQGFWREGLLELAVLSEAMGRLAPGEFSQGQLTEVRDWHSAFMPPLRTMPPCAGNARSGPRRRRMPESGNPA